MAVPTLALNDGRRIPQIGYGCWQLSDAQAPDLVGVYNTTDASDNRWALLARKFLFFLEKIE